MELDEIIKNFDNINNVKLDTETIIAVSNSYISKFYFDERLNALPKELKDGIKILMVSLTEENGGILEAIYNDKECNIYFKTYADSEDYLYDEIGATYKMRKMERENEELFENLALFCKMKFHKIDEVLDNNKNNN